MTETGWPLIPREALPAPVPAARRRPPPRPPQPDDPSRQLPFFGAETTEPAPADLAGLLAGPGRLGRMGGTARVSVEVDAAWRVHVLAAELATRGLVVNWRQLQNHPHLVRDDAPDGPAGAPQTAKNHHEPESPTPTQSPRPAPPPEPAPDAAARADSPDLSSRGEVARDGSRGEVPRRRSRSEVAWDGSRGEVARDGSLGEVARDGSLGEVAGGDSRAEVAGDGSLGEVAESYSRGEVSRGGSRGEVGRGGSLDDVSPDGSLDDLPPDDVLPDDVLPDDVPLDDVRPPDDDDIFFDDLGPEAVAELRRRHARERAARRSLAADEPGERDLLDDGRDQRHRGAGSAIPVQGDLSLPDPRALETGKAQTTTEPDPNGVASKGPEHNETDQTGSDRPHAPPRPRFEVLTAYSSRLNGLARAWPDAAAQLFLSGPRLRLWVAAAGEPVAGGYALGLDPAKDPKVIDAALVRAGLAGRFSEDGRHYLIMGKRRVRRLAEMVGERPEAAPAELWPGGAGA